MKRRLQSAASDRVTRFSEIMYTVKRCRLIGVQVGCSTSDLKEQGIQCSYSKGSYKRLDKVQEKKLTSYDDLAQNYFGTKTVYPVVARR